MDFFDIVVLMEIWLDNEFDDCDLYFEGYSIYCWDRCGKCGGGVLFVIKLYLLCVWRYDFEVNVEMLVCELKISNI